MTSVPPMHEIDPLPRALESYRHSAVHAEERALADVGECPSASELIAFARGTLADLPRREALAAHVLACPRCFDANLACLGRLERTRRRRRLGGVCLAAAAAAALLLWLGFAPSGATSGQPPHVPAPLEILGLVDAHGLSLRDVGVARAEAQRVLVAVREPGHVALARLIAGALALEDVDAGARSAAVSAGVEAVLPLHRALPAEPQAEWLVLFAPRALGDEELREAFASYLAARALPDGVRVARIH